MSLCKNAAAMLVGLGLVVSAAWAQSAPAQSAPASAADAPFAAFVIHGAIHSGTTKLPGVSVTASHSLTGRKVITSTDVDGSRWSSLLIAALETKYPPTLIVAADHDQH